MGTRRKGETEEEYRARDRERWHARKDDPEYQARRLDARRERYGDPDVRQRKKEARERRLQDPAKLEADVASKSKYAAKPIASEKRKEYAAKRRKEPRVRRSKLHSDRAHRSEARRTYGLLQAMMGWPLGCALCGIPDDPSQHRSLAVDHDHTTGHVRGLLCAGCNTTLGRPGAERRGVRGWAGIARRYMEHPPVVQALKHIQAEVLSRQEPVFQDP